jgi:ATP-dependent Clp protease ATP-binding subunit ClpC
MEEIENGKSGIQMSEELINLLDYIKKDLSQELPTLTIDINYFLLGVLSQKNSDLYFRLDSCMTSMAIQSMYNTWYQVVASRAITAIKPNRVPSYDAKMVEILINAEKEAINTNSDEVTSEHVFLAILADTDESNKIKKVFNKAGITYGIMKSKIKEGKPMSSSDETVSKITLPDGTETEVHMIKAKSLDEAKRAFLERLREMNGGDMDENMMLPPGFQRKKNGKNSYINDYCTNLNEQAKEGKIDRLVGREKEVAEIIRILGRKKKNNAILVGGEGVGKTAIGESLAWKIVNGEVPEFLTDKILVSLDMTALMAGTTLRGMFEERVKGIIDNVKSDGRFILFMDNIGAMLADKGKNDFDVSAMLSRALENGDIQVIGTSDFNSYRKTFDKDPSLARRFHKIIVEAPSTKESIEILNGLRASYEKFHKVKYSDEAINACVKLSERYITDRNLPDSAIDLMDEIGSHKGLINEPAEFKEYRATISRLDEEILKAKDDEKTAKQEEKAITIDKYNEAKKAFDKEREENPVEITKDDILEIVSIKTGIPVNSLTSDDKKKLVEMDSRIKEEVVGQDEAIETICKALKRSRVGLRKNGCMYSAICIGKTGVGKTLIAKKLAKELFGSEDALVRFDMSEFSDKVSVNKLIGSNPGYVGYEEGGQLTEAIKNKKHCVLLLDEIEKADPEVYNIFLQVLDEGFLTDNAGMRVDFSNVIVLFTSNIGAKTASEFSRGIGFNENEDENTKRILNKELKNRFPPEFLNRIDDVIYFNSLTDDNLKDIIKIEMGKLENSLASIGHEMTYDDGVVEYILAIVKNEKEFGARPIMRAIQDEIEDKITDAILENDYEDGHRFQISCCSDENEVVVA